MSQSQPAVHGGLLLLPFGAQLLYTLSEGLRCRCQDLQRSHACSCILMTSVKLLE